MYNILFLVAFLATTWQVKAGLSPELQQECFSNPTKKVNAMVDLPKLDPSSLLPSGRGFGIPGIAGIQDTFVNSLKTQAALAQLPIVNAIKTIHPNANTKGFWAANRIAVTDAPCGTLTAISLIPGVMNVRKEAILNIQPDGEEEGLTDTGVSEDNPAWGITKINAPSVWKDASNPTKGKGVVVANIDSGVHSSHKALTSNYRGGDFSWFDGVKNSSDGLPIDENGHGTHVMGTIAGQGGIGVAPESTWIACRGCDGKGSCAEVPLLTCGQWIMCPYVIKNGTRTEDCSKRPKIVNNSWGGPLGGDFYNEIIENWLKVGIIPVFAAGNSGPVCFTTGAPANQKVVISSVGATTINDTIARFSSKGPSPSTFRTKPEISAPGEKIYSSWNTGDTDYKTIDGTSMASPHVAGAIALLIAKKPNLTYEDVMKNLETTAVKPPSGESCDICGCLLNPLPFFCCFSSKAKGFPNNSFGYGRIDVAAAYTAI